MADDADNAVGADCDEYQGIVDPAVLHAICAKFLLRFHGAQHAGISDREHKAAEGGGALQEFTTARLPGFEVGAHGDTACSPATCLIAARMRV